MAVVASHKQCFVLRTRRRQGTAIVELQGQVDVSAADELTQALSSLLELDVKRLVVDLNAAEVTDSGGLAALVLAQKQARRRDGDLVLAGVTGETRRVLELTGLDRVFRVVPRINEP